MRARHSCAVLAFVWARGMPAERAVLATCRRQQRRRRRRRRRPRRPQYDAPLTKASLLLSRSTCRRCTNPARNTLPQRHVERHSRPPSRSSSTRTPVCFSATNGLPCPTCRSRVARYLAPQWLRKTHKLSRPLPELDWIAQIKKHLTNPEGYVMLIGYLATVWHCDLLPASYYDEQGGVSWPSVFLQLLIVDFLGFVMHKMEHGKR